MNIYANPKYLKREFRITLKHGGFVNAYNRVKYLSRAKNYSNNRVSWKDNCIVRYDNEDTDEIANNEQIIDCCMTANDAIINMMRTKTTP